MRRALRRLTIAMAVGVLAACTADAQVSRPSTEDVRRLLESDRSHPVLQTQIWECQRGQRRGVDVQVCGFCASWLAVNYQAPNAFRQGAPLQVWQGQGSVAFFRAVSERQPTIAPAPGGRGVWIADRSTLEVSTVQRATVERHVAQRLGYQPISGMSAYSEAAAADRARGGRVPAVVRERVGWDPETRELLSGMTAVCAPA